MTKLRPEIAEPLIRENVSERRARLLELEILKKCRKLFGISSNCHPLQVRARLSHHLGHSSDEVADAIIIAGGLLGQLAEEGRICPEMDIVALERLVSADVWVLDLKWVH